MLFRHMAALVFMLAPAKRDGNLWGCILLRLNMHGFALGGEPDEAVPCHAYGPLATAIHLVKVASRNVVLQCPTVDVKHVAHIVESNYMDEVGILPFHEGCLSPCQDQAL